MKKACFSYSPTYKTALHNNHVRLLLTLTRWIMLIWIKSMLHCTYSIFCLYDHIFIFIFYILRPKFQFCRQYQSFREKIKLKLSLLFISSRFSFISFSFASSKFIIAKEKGCWVKTSIMRNYRFLKCCNF